MGSVMVKKILALMLAFIFALNFSSVTFAKTLEEKAEEKAAKLQKKQEKKVAKAAHENNIKVVEAWAKGGDVQAKMILMYARETRQYEGNEAESLKSLRIKLKRLNADLLENFIPLEYHGKKIKLPRLYGIAACRSQIGQYVEQNFDDVIKWAQLGASENDTLSLAVLGAAYYTGRGVRQDYKQAVEYLKSAGNEPLALKLLSDAYAKGNGVEKDAKKSALYSNYLKLVLQPKIDEKRNKNSKKIDRQAK